MAPWPDKIVNGGSVAEFRAITTSTTTSNTSLINNNIPDLNLPNDNDAINHSPCNTEQANFKSESVTSLDDNGLKALLDEAMAYKLPKDVEGKSVLFKELLQEVDRKYAEPDSMMCLNTLSKTESLQRKINNKKNKIRKPQSGNNGSTEIISQNTGSKSPFSKNDIPTKLVNSVLNCEEKAECTENKVVESQSSDKNEKCNTTASNQIINTQKENQDLKMYFNSETNSCDVDHNSISINLPTNPKVQLLVTGIEANEQAHIHFTESYNAVKSLVNSEQKITTTHVEEMSLLQYKGELGENSNTNQANSKVAESTYVTLKDVPELLFAFPVKWSLVNNRTNPGNQGEIIVESSDSTTNQMAIRMNEEKKPDENGNTLAKVDEGRRGKTRRLKIVKNENVVISENIDGYRSDIASLDIESVMKFIEEPSKVDGKMMKSCNSGNLSNKQRRTFTNRINRDKSSENINRKSKKSKENKMNKSSSLEEISKSKIEDLTNDNNNEMTIVKQTTMDDLNIISDFEWENKNPYMCLESDSKGNFEELEVKTETKQLLNTLDDSGFHLVTKKQKKKKKSLFRKSECLKVSNNANCQRKSHGKAKKEPFYRYSGSQQDTYHKSAVSMPPSDMSGDSSDMDSVHSLPVSSSVQKPIQIKTSTSSDSTPQTSYADITRSMASFQKSAELHKNSYLKSEQPAILKSTSIIDKLNNNIENEKIPTVIIPLPKKQPAEYVSQNRDKDYPPLQNSVPNSEDMYFEFTVQVKNITTNSVSVDETVVVKSQPKKEVTETDKLLLSIPPVVLMEESKKENGSVNELVFGFEVNHQLLVNNDCNETTQKTSIMKSSNCTFENKEELLNVTDTIKELKLQNGTDSINPPIHVASLAEKYDFNYESILLYISGEWESIMEEHSESPDSGKIQYFVPT